jgi:hypothetical protein
MKSIILAIYFTALAPTFLLSQYGLKKNDNIILMTDSLISAQKGFHNTVLVNLRGRFAALVKTFSVSTDAITNKGEGSLSPVRLDSLKLIRTLLQKDFTAKSETNHPKLTEISNGYSKKLNSIKQITFDEESEAIDSLRAIDQAYREELTNSADEYYDGIKDSYDTALDSLDTYAQALLDIQNDERDLFDSKREIYYAYGLFGKAGYISDMQYRGYMGAAAHSAFYPGLTYQNSLGIGVYINAYNIQGTTVPWDEIEAGISYNHNFSESFSMSIGYTHYSFNDTIETARQGLTGIAGIGLSYEFPIISIGTSFDVSMGDQTDYSLSFNLSKRIELINRSTIISWIEPGFNVISGTESLLNEKINSGKIGNGNGNGHGNGKGSGGGGVIINTTVTTINSVFSILDYQISFPLTFEFSRLIIIPEYDYNIPVNQPPNTGSSNFGFFTVNIAVKIL